MNAGQQALVGEVSQRPTAARLPLKATKTEAMAASEGKLAGVGSAQPAMAARQPLRHPEARTVLAMGAWLPACLSRPKAAPAMPILVGPAALTFCLRPVFSAAVDRAGKELTLS